MTDIEAFHQKLTAKRANDTARLRYENHILRKLILNGWPVKTDTEFQNPKTDSFCHE
jgi:hypothetical protein